MKIPSAHRLKDSRLVKGFIATLLGSGFSKAILALSTFVFANMLSKSEFGEFSFLRSTLNTILCICALNFSSLCTKFTNEAKVEHRALHRLIVLYLFSIAICIVVGVALIVLPQNILLKVFVSEEILYYFRIIGVFLPLFIMQPLIEGTLRGLMHFKLIGILQTVSAIYFVIAVYLGIKLDGVTGAFCGIISYYFIYAVACIIVLLKLHPFQNLWENSKGFRKERSVIPQMILPIFLMSFFEAPVLWIAQLLLNKYGTMSAVGSMTAIMQIRNFIILIPSYFSNTFLSFASELNANKDYTGYLSKFRQLGVIFILTGLLLCMFFSVFASPILGLYGAEYKADMPSMIISNIGIPMLMLVNLYKIDLIIREHQKFLLYISIAWNLIWLISLYIFLKSGIPALPSFFSSQLAGLSVYLLGVYIVYNKDKKIIN